MADDSDIGDPTRINFQWSQKTDLEFQHRMAERASAAGKKVNELGREMLKDALLEDARHSQELREMKAAVADVGRRLVGLQEELERLAELIPAARKECQGSVILLGSLIMGAIDAGAEASRAERNEMLASYVRQIFGDDEVDAAEA